MCGGGGGNGGEKDDKFYMRKLLNLQRLQLDVQVLTQWWDVFLSRMGKLLVKGFILKLVSLMLRFFALREAGDKAENATAYGVEKLRNAGIDVMVAVEEELCKNLNEAYIHRMLTGKPFVTLRYSQSVNGQILDKVGLAAKEPGGYYSQLLQAYDGVILSSGSLTGDSTFPISQEPQAKQPLQIVVARPANSPVQIPVLTNDAATQVIIFAENDTVVNFEATSQGVETVVMDKVNLNAILDYCASRGLCSVLVDFFGDYKDLEQLVEEGLEQGLVQKVVMEVLPVWEGRKESEIQTTKKLEREVRKLKKITVYYLK
ncbi:hypothetical protein MKW92_038620 [Papaver armeniacum]|nr:hypothetical protein MKW92_038620 [Papaver armeniacum]